MRSAGLAPCVVQAALHRQPFLVCCAADVRLARAGQTARYLVKQLLAARAGRPAAAGSAEYTHDAGASLAERCPVASSRDWLDHGTQSAAFRWGGRRHCGP